MRYDPIARAHAQLGTAKRQRDYARASLADTLADLEAALSIICRLPDTPERTALYALLEGRSAILRKTAPRTPHHVAPGLAATAIGEVNLAKDPCLRK